MIIIGEKINATIPHTKKIITKRDAAALADMAATQTSAGAHYLDVNVATGSGSREDEISDMQWAIRVIQDSVDTPLCIDSADETVLEAGLSTLDGRKCMINSVQGEHASIKAIIPLAKKYGAMLVALPMDETGIPKTVQERLSVCERILEACKQHGIPQNMLLFDPLVLPISTDTGQGNITLDTIAAVKKHYAETLTVMGLSNISYGLPQRKLLNTGFLTMAVYAGLDAVIINPGDTQTMQAITIAEALAGKDRHCRRYSKAFRR